jgi:hypothetical protein
VIDHLEHASSGTPLYYGTELTTNIDGPYHYATGTRSQQFLLKDEAGKTYYGYCIDLATGAENGTWYALANLEDNDYYASEDAEDHVRGIVFNGLLATMGSTHKGVVRAIIVTSVLFGLAHVDFETDFVDGLSVIQALLKTCQTGMYSFMLCVIMLRTHRLGGVSLFHGFDDFVLVMPSIALFGEALDTEYVVQGDDAIPTIMYYLVIIALYLPFVVKSGLELRRGQDVTRGAFMEKYVAQQQEQAQLAAAPEPAAPAMSLGCPAAPVASSPVQFDVPVPTTPPSASDYKPLETLMVPDAAFVTPEGIGTPATPEATVVPVASMAHAPVAEPVTPAEAQVASVTSQVGVGGPAPVVQDTPSMPGPAPAGASRATGLPPIPKGL